VTCPEPSALFFLAGASEGDNLMENIENVTGDATQLLGATGDNSLDRQAATTFS